MSRIFKRGSASQRRDFHSIFLNRDFQSKISVGICCQKLSTSLADSVRPTGRARRRPTRFGTRAKERVRIYVGYELHVNERAAGARTTKRLNERPLMSCRPSNWHAGQAIGMHVFDMSCKPSSWPASLRHEMRTCKPTAQAART